MVIAFNKDKRCYKQMQLTKNVLMPSFQNNGHVHDAIRASLINITLPAMLNLSITME